MSINNQEIDVFTNSIFVVELDLEGNIVYLNRRYAVLLGSTEEALIGKPYTQTWHPDMPKGVYRGMSKIITDNKIWRGYIKHISKDGSFFWTLSYMHAKVDNEGNLTGFSSTGKVAHESTRKEVEEKYKELRDDKYIDHKYFMASESYYDTQISPRVNSEAYD